MAPVPAELRHRQFPNENPDIGKSIGDAAVTKDKDRKLIGINGTWYDATSFLPHHPGGPIIQHFVGQDATHVFESVAHNPSVLKRLKAVGTYTPRMRHPADQEFEDLLKFFKEKGFFKTSLVFYIQKIMVCAMLFATMICCVALFENMFIHLLGGVALAFFWQQCGFVMHEFMHTQVIRKGKKDRVGGTIFGTIFFGMSAHWWRDEHIIHHAMTNTVDVAGRFADPQMWEAVWAQNAKLYPLFKGYLQYWLIKIQHYTFVPVVIICGRLEIMYDSYMTERRWYERVCIILHWAWISWVFSLLPTWTEVALFYTIAALVEGIFHFQLILSHYCKLFLTVEDFHNTSWFVYQVLTNMNIDCPRWLDWYYGGLQFHIEHHLFPTLARNHLREASVYVQDICKRHKISYDSCPFMEALRKTLVSLKKAGSHYKIDPR